MILVVADTGPIRYLVLIEAIEVLARLYDRVVLPQAVFAELTHAHAPEAVQRWAVALPDWAEVRKASGVVMAGVLDLGETEAIALAQELHADSLLLDEVEARQFALRLGLPVAGTVGVLEKAAERGWIDLAEALHRLTRTNFRIAPELLREALTRDGARRDRSSRNPGLKP
jgi:predicted nucleic acid-binding protein